MTQSDGHFETRDDEQLVSDQIAGEAALTAPGPRRDVSADIAAEIDDHLAEASAAAQTTGLSQQQARQSAHSRFGDVASIARRCWWINRGEIVMFRSAAIVLMSICVLGLFLVAYSAWRIEASFTDQMDALSSQLAALNQTQQKMLENADRPGEPAAAQPERAQITGKLYLGDPSIPAANADVEVWNAKTTERVRQMRTDSNGEFATGQLPDGEYFVLASLVGEGNPQIQTNVGYGLGSESRQMFCVQSPAYAIWPDGQSAHCELDVKLEMGEVSLELSRDVAEAVGPVEDQEFPLRIRLRAFRDTNITLPTFFTKEPGFEFPIHGGIGGHTLYVDADGEPPLRPTGMGGPRLADGLPVTASYHVSGPGAGMPVLAGEHVLHASLGPLMRTLQERGGRGEDPRTRAMRDVVDSLSRARAAIGRSQSGNWTNDQPFNFEVRPNQLTRLRIVVPEGYEDSLNAALTADVLDEEELVRLCALMPLEIELIGYEPLQAAE